jgi:hypothetical protein
MEPYNNKFDERIPLITLNVRHDLSGWHFDIALSKDLQK